MKRTLPLFLALSAWVVVPSIGAVAQSAPGAASEPVVAPTVSTVDPAARTLLEESEKAYAALKGLSMEFTVTEQRGEKTSTTSGSIALSWPDKGKVVIKTGNDSLIALTDGKTIYSQTSARTFQAEAVAEDEDSIDSLLQDFPSSLGAFLPSLASGFDLLADADPPWESATLLPDGRIAMKSQPSVGMSMTSILSFDPTDKLLRRVEATIEYQGITSSNTTTLTEIKVNPQFPPGEFSLKSDAKIVSLYDQRLKVGARPFALKGRDLQGKTHPWSQYKGKVVLLDFWATWCGPCVRDLPNVLKIYKTYHPKGFEIIGVSLDSDKKALTDFVKARGLTYPQLFDGKRWGNANAASYGVRAVPFSLLVGKDGRIAAVNPQEEDLEAAVEEALTAKVPAAKVSPIQSLRQGHLPRKPRPK
jgi:thiol-disulfide isomerase/thioredoxin